MFKHFVLSAICLLFIVSSQAQKVGYINTQELVALMPEVKEANSQLEVMKTQFSKRGQDMLQVLQQNIRHFSKNRLTVSYPLLKPKTRSGIKSRRTDTCEF